jgi:thiamine pyrophosphate-dependent acetolactate synthase large subunit-like protein
MNVSEAIASSLVAEGISLAAGLAGTHVGRLLDAIALREEIDLMYARQERAAFDIADGFARASGKPAVVFTDSGPAAANTMGGLVNSWGDSTPVLFFAGHVNRSLTSFRDTKEIPFLDLFAPVSKWAAIIDHPSQLQEILRRAFMQLRSGRPGPVVIGLPHDVSGMDVGDFTYTPVSSQGRIRPSGDPDSIDRAVDMIASAKRPYLYAGAGVLFSEATEQLVAFSELLSLPVATTLNGKSAFPEDHPLSLGIGGFIRGRYNTLPASETATSADVIISIGCGFKYEATRRSPAAGVKLIQIDIEPGEINRSQMADIAIQGDARLVLQQMIASARARFPASRLSSVEERAAGIKVLRKRWEEVCAPELNSDAVPMNPFRVTKELCALIDPARTVMLHDAGTVRGTICYHYPAVRPRNFLGFGAQSSMGWSIGAAFGAKKADPSKLVVAIIGEEAFQETAMDIETSVRNDAPVLILVKNNRKKVPESNRNDKRLDYVRFHRGLDIGAFAAAVGARTIRIEDTKDLSSKLAEAIALVKSGETTVVDVVTTRVNPNLDRLWFK